MRYYELTCLISPHFSEENLISYLPTEPIKKQLTSSFISLEFYAQPEQIAEIEKKLKADSQILRFIILAKETARAKTKAVRKLTKKTLMEPEKKTEEKKVELKEIEKKLEEILEE